ncbi:MAG: hypothetical protein WDM90_05870 [Ferruginibacter sp.]
MLTFLYPMRGQLNGADTAWSSTIAPTANVLSLQTNLLLDPARDSFEVNATSTRTIITANGLQITFPPNSCVTSTGAAITGKVYLEIRFIKTKGDMILMNKPTSSNGSMLVSGGEIFLSITKDGQPVKLAPNVKIYFHYADAPTYQQMKLFVGDESNPGQVNWLPNTNASSLDTVIVGPQTYDIVTSHLRWINCDYFYDTTGISRSLISTNLPSNYTNTNTATFLVFRELRSVLSMHADANERRFISDRVPNGKLVTVVVISKQGNDYFLGKESATTGVNASTVTGVQKVTVTPVKTSLADIRNYLATL